MDYESFVYCCYSFSVLCYGLLEFCNMFAIMEIANVTMNFNYVIKKKEWVDQVFRIICGQ